MPPKTYISSWQAVLLVLFACISTTILYVPGQAVTIVHQDVWIAVLLAMVTAAVFLYYPLADLGMHFPGKTIVEYSELILGRYVGKVYGFLITYYFFQVHCWTLREFGELSRVILPQTPIAVFMIFFSCITIFAVYYGVETIGRCAEFVFPLGVLALILILIAGLMSIDFSRIQPLMESGFLPLIKASISPLDWLTVGFVFGVISSFIKDERKLKKIGFMAIGIAGFLLASFSLINIVILGVPVLEVTNFPLLAVAQVSRFPGFERIELLVIGLWITWIFIRGAVFSFAAVLSIAQLFRFEDYRFLIVVETVFAISYAVFQYESFVEQFYLYSVGHLFYLLFQMILPFLLWLVFLFRSKSGMFSS